MANQTIIQAAGQRYAPIKTDYSGYIQGLASVATALVEKRKLTNKNIAALNKLREGTQTDITPWGDFIKGYIDYSEDSLETKQVRVEHLKKGTLRLEGLQTKLADMVDPDNGGLTESLDPDIENWIRSYALGEFDETFTIKEKMQRGGFGVGFEEEGIVKEEYLKEKEFNMNFWVDENFNPMVIGPKGEYITMDEFEDFLNVASAADGNEVVSLISKFPNLPGVRVRDDLTQRPEEAFMGAYRNTLDEIELLFKSGTGTASGENVMTAFMFDSSFRGKDGEHTNFIDWYLSNEDLFPDDFKKLYGEYREGYTMGGENEKKMLNIIAQDLIKNDPNIKEDLIRFIEATLNEYK